MQEIKRSKEINITASEIYEYNKKKKKKSFFRRHSQNKLVKALYTAFMVASGAAVVVVAMLTTSLNSVTLYAKNATSLIFNVSFDEKNTEIQYVLRDNNDNFYYPNDEYYERQEENEEKSRYIHFVGLEPDTEYLFTVTDLGNDSKTLYQGTYITSKEDFDISCHAWFEHDMIYGEVFASNIDPNSFYTVIIEDKLGKKLFSKDYAGNESSEQSFFEVSINDSKETNYNLYIKYKNNIIYQQTIARKHFNDKFIEAYTELKNGNLLFSCYYQGYSDLILEISDVSSKVLVSRELNENDTYFTLSNFNDDVYYYTIKENQEIVYSGEIYQIIENPRAEISKLSFVNGQLDIEYQVLDYSGEHYIMVKNSLGEVEFSDAKYSNNVNISVSDLSDLEYTIEIGVNNTTLLIQRIAQSYEPSLDYSYDFKYGVLTLTYLLNHLESTNQYTLDIIDEDGEIVFSDDFDYLERTPNQLSAYVSVSPKNKTIVVKNLYKDNYVFTIVQNGNELFRETLEQYSPPISLDLDYTLANGILSANVYIPNIGENSLDGYLEDSSGRKVHKFLVSENFTLDYSDLNQQSTYSFVIYLGNNELYRYGLTSQNDDFSLDDIILLNESKVLPSNTDLGYEITYSLSSSDCVKVENNVLIPLSQNIPFEVRLIAKSKFIEKEAIVYSRPILQNKVVTTNECTYYFYAHPLISDFKYELNGALVTPTINLANSQNQLVFRNLSQNSTYNLRITYNNQTLYEDEFTTLTPEEVSVSDFNYTFNNGQLDLSYKLSHLEGEYSVQIKNSLNSTIYSNVFSDSNNSINLSGLSDENYNFIILVSGKEIFYSPLVNVIDPTVSSQYSFVNGSLKFNYVINHLKSEYSLLVLDLDENTEYALSSELSDNTIDVSNLKDKYYYVKIYIGNDEIYSVTIEQTFNPVISTSATFVDGKLDLNYSIEYYESTYNVILTSIDGVVVYSFESSENSGNVFLEGLEEEKYTIEFIVNDNVVYSEKLIQVLSPEVSLEYEFLDGNLDISYFISNLSTSYVVKITKDNSIIYTNTKSTSEDSISLSSLSDGSYMISFLVNNDIIYEEALIQDFTPNVSLDYDFYDAVLDINYEISHYNGSYLVELYDENGSPIYSESHSSQTNSLHFSSMNYSSYKLVFIIEEEVVYSQELDQSYSPSVNINYQFLDGNLSINYSIAHLNSDYVIKIFSPSELEILSETKSSSSDSYSFESLENGDYIVQFIIDGIVIYEDTLIQNYTPSISLEYTFTDGYLYIDYSIEHVPSQYSVQVANTFGNIEFSELRTTEKDFILLSSLAEENYVFSFYVNDVLIASQELIQEYSPNVSFDGTFVDGNLNISYTIDHYNQGITVRLFDDDSNVIGDYVIEQESGFIELSDLDDYESVSIIFLYNDEIIANSIIEHVITPKPTVSSFEYTLKDGILYVDYTLENISSSYLVQITNGSGSIAFSETRLNNNDTITLTSLPEGNYLIDFYIDNTSIFNQELIQEYSPGVSFEYTFLDGNLRVSYSVNHFKQGISARLFGFNSELIGEYVIRQESGVIELSDLGDNESVSIIFLYDDEIIANGILEQSITPIPVVSSCEYVLKDGNLNVDYTIENSSSYLVQITNVSGSIVFSETRTSNNDSITLTSLDEGDYSINFFVDELSIFSLEMIQEYSPSVYFEHSFIDGNLRVSYAISHYKEGITIRLFNDNSEVIGNYRVTSEVDFIELSGLVDIESVSIAFLYNDEIIANGIIEQVISPKPSATVEYTFKDGYLEVDYSIANLSSSYLIKIMSVTGNIVYSNTDTTDSGNIALRELGEGNYTLTITIDDKNILTQELIQEYTPSVSVNHSFLDGNLHVTYSITNFKQGINYYILNSDESVLNTASISQSNGSFELSNLNEYTSVVVLFICDEDLLYEENIEQAYTIVPTAECTGTLIHGTLSFNYSISNALEPVLIQIMNPKGGIVREIQSESTSDNVTIKDMFLDSYTISFVFSSDTIPFEIVDSSPELDVTYEHSLAGGNLDLFAYVTDIDENNSLTLYIRSVSGSNVYSSNVLAENHIELTELESNSTYYLVIQKGDSVLVSYDLEYEEDSIELPDMIFLYEDGYYLPQSTNYGFPISYSMSSTSYAQIEDGRLICTEYESAFSFELVCTSNSTEKRVMVYSPFVIDEYEVTKNTINYWSQGHPLIDQFTYLLNGESVSPYIESYPESSYTSILFVDLSPETIYTIEIYYQDEVLFEDQQTTYGNPTYEFTDINLSYDSISFTFNVTSNPMYQSIYVESDEELITGDAEGTYRLIRLDRLTTYSVRVMCDEEELETRTFTTTNYPDLIVSITNENVYDNGKGTIYSYYVQFTLDNVFDRDIQYYINGELVEAEENSGTAEVVENPSYYIAKRYSEELGISQITLELKETIIIDDEETTISLFSHQAVIGQ